MNTTNTDNFSLLASLVGFALAIYAIVTQPVQVDSKRPSQTGNEPKAKPSELAFERLWDDPFAIYSETDDASMLKPSLPTDGDTLFLIVPTKTQQYEEDRENRIRMRYAIQRALIDQGFAAEPGYLLSSLRFALPHDWVNEESGAQTTSVSNTDNLPPTPPAQPEQWAPVQFFIQRPLQTKLFKGSNDSRFKCVAVIWLPEVHAWRRTEGEQNQYLDVLIKALNDSINQLRPREKKIPDDQDRGDRWVFLGPSDSDGLAFYQKYPPYFYREVSQGPASANADLSIVPYSATIAKPILDLLPKEGCTIPSPVEFKELPVVAGQAPCTAVPVIRLSNGDDILCAELLRAIHTVGSLPPHTQTIHVTVFAEWDTLYGRALSETFAALASHGLSAPLDDPANYPAVLEELEKGLLAHYPPVTVAAGGKIRITVIPYLRGLDGASSLYRASYGEASENSASNKPQDQSSGSHPSSLIEAAEGTTQFDYIRRLTSETFTHNVPFWPQIERPDAVVIFGTDIYDKLVLLEFLRQQLRNCLYLTTDLDALYWHPHYLRYTRGLIVASAFPLQMSATLCGSTQGSNAICAPVEFRDSYQSAAYLVVTRCLQQSNALSRGTFDFTPDSFLYRIGNTKPLPVLVNSFGGHVGEPLKSPFDAFVEGLGAWIGGLLDPIMEGTSSFWPFVIQMTVIGLGLYSLFLDVPRRMQLSHAAADELWNSALALVPISLRPKLADFRTNRILPLWQKLPLRRQPWQAAPTKPTACKPQLEKQPVRFWRRWVHALFRTLVRGERTVKNIPPECICNPGFAVEIQPFADYLRRDLTTPVERSKDVNPDQKSALRRWILKSLHFLDRRLPHQGFILVGFATFCMLAAICLQPVPFLVGPATLSYGWRVVFWIVSVAALLVTFSLFHRICYEQHRFRRLIQALQALISNPDLGISNRQLVLVLSKASEPVANLTIVPCALVFLIYASHLNPLGGVAMAGELSVLLGLSLLTMLYSYTHLRGAAIAARSAVLEAYRKEETEAARLIARLESYANGTQPLQDDEDSLVHGLEQLIGASSTTPTDACQGIAKRIKEQTFRQGLREYLESVIRRDRTFVQQLGEIRSGVLAPLLTNPITAALMIPIGGASGLSVIEWLVSNAR